MKETYYKYLNKTNDLETKDVVLPFGKIIKQSIQGQGISSDISNLINTILEIYDESPLNLLELGSGIGIISIMIGFYRQNWTISGVEIQKQLYLLSQKNAKNAQVNVDFYKYDFINNLSSLKKKFCPDIIISNPPYFPIDKHRLSPIPERAISRSEIFCTMSEILKVIKELMSNCGSAYLIYPMTRKAELEEKVKKVDLFVHKFFFFNEFSPKKSIFMVELKHVKNL